MARKPGGTPANGGNSFNSSRRGFLGSTGLAAMGAIVGSTMPLSGNGAGNSRAHTHRPVQLPRPPRQKGPQYLKFPGKNEGLVVLGDKPLVAETPESLLDDDTTPIEKFYIRNNGQIPEETKDPDAWKITIDGEVNNKIEITLGELKSKYKAVTRRMVLECGGNGRAAFSPPARGNQWTNGGAGCAEWTGVPLADVLKAAGLKPSRNTPRIMPPTCICRATPASRPSRAACASRRLMDPDTMIVWGMNGQPLPNIHGGPVRLIVPGWAGSASQKWLTRITIRDKEHDGPGMTEFSYRIADQADGARRQGRSGEFPHPGIDAGALDHHQSGERREVRGRHQGAEAARRILGRRSHGQAGRCLDRFRRELAAGQAGKAEEQI